MGGPRRQNIVSVFVTMANLIFVWRRTTEGRVGEAWRGLYRGAC